MANIVVVWVVWCAGTLGPGRPGWAANVQGQRSPTAPPPVLWVLAIGVSRYQQREFNLQFADADARDVAAVLQHQEQGPLYKAAKTLVLTNEEVTRESILDSMGRFLGQAGPNDVAVIFVAGHGVQDRASGSYYFLPFPATASNHVTAGVRMSDFDEMLRVVRQNVRGVVLMLDTCHAGALQVAAPNLTAMEDPAARLTVSEGFFLLAAAKPGEESQERPELGHGAFSAAVLQGLQGAADTDGNRVVSVSELFGFVARTVADLTGGAQHPYSKVEGTDLRLVAVKPGAWSLPTRPASAPMSPAVTAAFATPVPNTVAVMEFRNVRTDPEHDWVGVALRAAFNTELSKVRALNVYAPEMIDRTVKVRGADQLTTAQGLGIDRLVTGSFSVVGNAIRIDARIVYAASGLQEGSDSVQGELSNFFDLQKKLVFSMLRRLHVSPSAEEGQSIENKTNTDVNAYRLLLETEEVVEEATPRPKSPSSPSPRRTRPAGSPRARLNFDWDALVAGVFPRAYAAELDPAVEIQVRQLMEEYRQALDHKDLNRLATLYVTFPTSRRDTLQQYFDNARELAVELADLTLAPHGDGVVVSYTRRDRFVDRESGKPVRLEVRLTRIVTHEGNTWKIAGKP